MWNFITTPSGVLGIILSVVSLYAVVITKMYGGLVDESNRFRITVEQAKEQAEEAAQHLRTEHERLLGIYGDAWSRSIAARPAVRVQHGNCNLPQTGAVSTSTKEPDATSAEQRPDTITINSEECQRRIENGIIDASHVRYLQQWIIDQHEVSK